MTEPKNKKYTIWYKIRFSYYGVFRDIRRVKVYSKTSCFVNLENGREKIATNHHVYYETWEEAYKNLVKRAKTKMDLRQHEYQCAKEGYKIVKNLKKPENED